MRSIVTNAESFSSGLSVYPFSLVLFSLLGLTRNVKNVLGTQMTVNEINGQ